MWRCGGEASTRAETKNSAHWNGDKIRRRTTLWTAIGGGQTQERAVKGTRKAVSNTKETFSYLICAVHSDLIFCLSSYRRRWSGGARRRSLHRLGTRWRGGAAAKSCPYGCGHARTRRRPAMDSAAARGRRVVLPSDAGIATWASQVPTAGRNYAVQWRRSIKT